VARLRDSRRARLAGAVLLLTLASLAAFGYQLRRWEAEHVSEPVNPPAPIEVDRFAARLEKGSDDERLNVSLRLRATGAESIECFVFVVARSDRVTPRVWAIWPGRAPGAISSGGHFHAAHPASGHAATLTEEWERIEAVIPRQPGQPPFDEVVAYVVSPAGTILLARPFAL
jgi:hypothetical protein